MPVDVSQLKEFQKKLQRLADKAQDQFCRECARELAAKLLELVIPLTPVYEDYDAEVNFTTKDSIKVSFFPDTGKQGGTLRRGWTAETEQEALNSPGTPSASDQKGYVDSLVITKTGKVYYIEVVNPVFYASYVEFGHRTVNGGWQPGKFMLTLSEHQLMDLAPEMLEEKLEKALKEVFHDS